MWPIPSRVRAATTLLPVLLLLLIGAAACKHISGLTVHSISFKGVEQISASELKQALATHPNSWLPWGRKHAFDKAQLEADLKRIEAFYADRGFPDAKVTGFDVATNKASDSVDITIDVSEGQPVLVARIEYDGFGEIPSKQLRQVEHQAPLQQDKRLDHEWLVSTREMALNALRDYGYPYARVSIHEQPTGTPRRVAIVFNAEPGTKAYFGDVQVAGNKSVGDKIIRRELQFHPGQPYSRRLVLESQRRLYNLQLFQFASITPAKPGEESAEIPMRVTVAEGKHQRVQFSGGYGSEEKVRVAGEWQNVNFLGGARVLGVNGKWSSLDRGVRASFTQPYVFNSSLSFDLEGHQWYDDEPVYHVTSSGGRASFTHGRNARTTYTLAFSDDFESSSINPSALASISSQQYAELIALGLNPETGTQSGTLASVSVNAQHSSVTNPLTATSGYYVAGHVEQAGHWVNGTFSFTALSVEVRKYQPLSGHLVLAGRLRYSTIHPGNGVASEVPFFKRLFLGGADSLRGWGRYEVSPLGASGLPIGGFTSFEGSIEGRTRLVGKLGAVLFADFGNVWTGPWDIHLDDLRYDVGPGLRYETPLGPVRVDVGYQLNPIAGLVINGQPQTRRWRIHFSIGQAF